MGVINISAQNLDKSDDNRHYLNNEYENQKVVEQKRV